MENKLKHKREVTKKVFLFDKASNNSPLLYCLNSFRFLIFIDLDFDTNSLKIDKISTI